MALHMEHTILVSIFLTKLPCYLVILYVMLGIEFLKLPGCSGVSGFMYGRCCSQL